MFSNLASYIFGGSSEEQQVDLQQARSPSNDPQRKPGSEDEWVVVGGDVQPALTLGSLDEVAPRPSTGSTGSSATPSEAGGADDEMVIVDNEDGDDHISEPREIALTRSARRLTSPLACPNGISLPQMKALRTSQKSKQKDAAKHLTSKATERHNKAVKIRSNHPGKKNKAANLAIRASGCNKNLKQC
jgi:hypothetical protein